MNNSENAGDESYAEEESEEELVAPRKNKYGF